MSVDEPMPSPDELFRCSPRALTEDGQRRAQAALERDVETEFRHRERLAWMFGGAPPTR